MKSTTKQWIFFLALPIYTLLGAFLLQRIIYVYLNGLISEMLFLLITIIPSIAIIIYISVYNKSLEEYGFHLHKPIIQLFCGIVLYVFMGIFFRFTFLSPPPFSEALRNIIAKFDRINIANFFYIFNMLLNVLTEEILWRGFVLTFLSKKLNNFLSNILKCKSDEVYTKIEKLLDQIIARKPLHEYGMKEEEIESFAKTVEETQQRLLNQSYVKLTWQQMAEIYKELY